MVSPIVNTHNISFTPQTDYLDSDIRLESRLSTWSEGDDESGVDACETLQLSLPTECSVTPTLIGVTRGRGEDVHFRKLLGNVWAVVNLSLVTGKPGHLSLVTHVTDSLICDTEGLTSRNGRTW